MNNRKKWIKCFVLSGDAIACKDGLFRRSVFFGTPSSSCRFWKSKAWARKFAQRHAGPEYTIKFVYAGDSVDCFGNVTGN